MYALRDIVLEAKDSLMLTRKDKMKIDEVNAKLDRLMILFTWDKAMEYIDAVQNVWKIQVMEELMRKVKKYIQSKDGGVVWNALSLVEALVKNGGRNVHRSIGQERFLNVLQNVYKKSANDRIRDKILELIQDWGEAFLEFRKEMPGFTKVYHVMRKQGIAFPNRQYDDSKVPVFMPAARSNNADAYATLNNEAFMEVVENVVEMAQDIVETGNGPNSHVLEELKRQCQSFAPRLVKMVQEETNEECLLKYLNANDTMQILLQDDPSNNEVSNATVVKSEVLPKLNNQQSNNAKISRKPKFGGKVPLLQPPPNDTKLGNNNPIEPSPKPNLIDFDNPFDNVLDNKPTLASKPIGNQTENPFDHL